MRRVDRLFEVLAPSDRVEIPFKVRASHAHFTLFTASATFFLAIIQDLEDQVIF